MDLIIRRPHGIPVNWHQILGKGSISGTAEDDNYQLFQIGNSLVFEWNDRLTNTHYQAITQNPVLGNDWNYVTASISGGSIKIYNNGAEQPLVFNQGLDPRYVTPPAFPGRPGQTQCQSGHGRQTERPALVQSSITAAISVRYPSTTVL